MTMPMASVLDHFSFATIEKAASYAYTDSGDGCTFINDNCNCLLYEMMCLEYPEQARAWRTNPHRLVPINVEAHEMPAVDDFLTMLLGPSVFMRFGRAVFSRYWNQCDHLIRLNDGGRFTDPVVNLNMLIAWRITGTPPAIEE